MYIRRNALRGRPISSVGDPAKIQQQLKQIVKLYFDKVYSKEINLMQDSSLLREWSIFNTYAMAEIQRLYLLVSLISEKL